MKRHLIALVGACGALLAAGPGVAAAQSVQGAEQYAGTGQSAGSNASSTQTSPSNSNIDVRIFSPGDGGGVSQSNSSAAGAAAGNQAATGQAVGQAQSGSGVQAAGQAAETAQEATANAESKQVNPSNSNISVRIHSPGDNGAVEQSNDSSAKAFAGNEASTEQAADQDQGRGGKCCSASGVQAAGQEAGTWQKADADAKSVQYKPTNSNVGVRIGSEGDNGSVSQSNSSAAAAKAGNEAATKQIADQRQSGGGCRCPSDLVQAVGQKALTGQHADADATSFQAGAKNANTPVRTHSGGDDGDVEQSNSSTALSGAFNTAKTIQVADQDQRGDRCGCPLDPKHPKDPKDPKGSHGKDSGGHHGARVQAVGQWAETWQEADSDATSKQLHPSNHNAPVRTKSGGGDGSVSQSNDSFAAALSFNAAFTAQLVRQSQ